MKRRIIYTVFLILALLSAGCQTDMFGSRGSGGTENLPGFTATGKDGYLAQGPTTGVGNPESGGSLMEALEKTTRELMLERERNQQLEEKLLILEAEKKKCSQDLKRFRLLEMKVAELQEKDAMHTEEISRKDIVLKKKQEEVDESLLKEKELTKKYIELKIEKVRLEKRIVREEIDKIKQ